MAEPDTDQGIARAFPLRKLPTMEAAQFRQWAALLESRTGMQLPEGRVSFLVTNLGIRMRALGLYDYQEYYDFLGRGSAGRVEWDRLLDHLTVHETRFFRHPPTLEFIRDVFLPEYTDRHTAGTLQAWSVGCSTGEEPYGIAMVLDQYLRRLAGPYYFGVLASDISRRALAVGRIGIYPAHHIKDVVPEYVDTYFHRGADGAWQVAKQLRDRVCFSHLNILDLGRAPIGKMDLIVCQNLLIYYDRQRREEIAATLAEHLAPGGMMMLGVGELVHWTHPRLERVAYDNTLAYRNTEHDNGRPAP